MSSASNTIRRVFCFLDWVSKPANMPQRSKSPDCARSGAGCASTNSNCLPRKSWSRQSKPSAFAMMRWEVSSKATKMPGSAKTRAPFARNCRPKMVFPEPGPPCTKAVRARGRPPPVISSKPAIPVGAFLDAATKCERTAVIVPSIGYPSHDTPPEFGGMCASQHRAADGGLTVLQHPSPPGGVNARRTRRLAEIVDDPNQGAQCGAHHSIRVTGPRHILRVDCYTIHGKFQRPGQRRHSGQFKDRCRTAQAMGAIAQLIQDLRTAWVATRQCLAQFQEMKAVAF